MEAESTFSPTKVENVASTTAQADPWNISDEKRAQAILVELEAQGPARSGEVLDCPLCMKSFSYRNGLIRHLKTLHLKEKPYKCDVCDRSFGYKNILVEHQNLHYGIKPYSCSHCGKRFAARSNLVQHRVSHKNSFSCHLCYKVFEKPGEFKRHLMDSHPRGTLECGSCDFVAKSQRQLSQHVMSLHVVNAGCVLPRSSSESDGTSSKISDCNTVAAVDRKIPSCPLPSIDTFQSLQAQPPVAQSFNSLFDVNEQQLDHPVFNSNFPSTIKRETDYPSCSFSDIATINRDIKREPLSPNEYRPYNYLQCTNAPIKSEQELTLCHIPFIETSSNSPGATKRVATQSLAAPSPKRPRLSSHAESSNAATPIAADSTTNVADLMNSLQSWMDRWNESSHPGAPQISITITPRSTHASPDGTPARPPSIVPDVDQVISQEINLGRLFECQHCGILFRERGLYFLHASLHDSVTPFRCSICHTTCNDKNDFHLHFVNQPHHD